MVAEAKHVSIREVARRYGCSDSVVRYNIAKAADKDNNYSVANRRRKGRPPALSERHNSPIKQVLVANRKKNLKGINRELKDIDINVSEATLRKRIDELGFNRDAGSNEEAPSEQGCTPEAPRTA